MRIEALNVLCNVANGKNKEHSDYIYTLCTQSNYDRFFLIF